MVEATLERNTERKDYRQQQENESKGLLMKNDGVPSTSTETKAAKSNKSYEKIKVNG